jgi:hypothetical protein
MKNALVGSGRYGFEGGVGRRLAVVFAMALSLSLLAGEVSGQTTLADYDYENLSFRGFSLETGHIWPTRTDNTYTLGLRVDLGYLGPGLRLIPGVAYWSSSMKNSEVRELERKVDALVNDQIEPGSGFTGVDLGTVDWSDFILSLDGHIVWSIPLDLLTFAGGGLSLHIMNGEGDALSGTFVEDLLDSVNPGFNLHAGLEYPLADQFRLYGVARYEIMEDLRYPELRIGGQFMLKGPAPGEGR